MNQPWFRRSTLAGAGVAGAASLYAVQAGLSPMAATNAATLAVVAACLLWGERRRDEVRATRLWLLGALAAGFGSSLMVLAYGVATGHAPAEPWWSDLLALAFAPFAVVALLQVPAASDHAGHRTRTLADALVAGSSLWFMLAALPVDRAHPPAGWAAAYVVASPVADVFVVATALAVLARCTSSARPMVARTVAGLLLLAAVGMWPALTGVSEYGRGPALLCQCSLLVLVLAAVAAPSTGSGKADSAAGRGAWVVGAAPYVPLIASMVLTTRLVVRGAGMERTQVLPALLVAVALAGRQFAAARDKQRLIGHLVERERGLQAALRCDDLTGLANRRGMMERLDAALESPSQWPVSIALLDLNDFKIINDNHGHAVGDSLLQELARRLSANARSGDVVARLGGDEFAVIGPDARGDGPGGLARRVLDALAEPVEIGGRPFTITASVGVVMGQPTDTGSRLLAYADAAMYVAKDGKDGASRVHLLSAGERSTVSRRLQIQEAMAKPDVAQFHVVYQPVVDLATGHIRGLEALLRWTHPTLGTIPPDLFIPLAEQARTIGVLGEHVLDTAISDLSLLQQRRPEQRLSLGINVSPRQLTEDQFAGRVLARIADRGLAREQIVLEITEQAFEADLDSIRATVDTLVHGGVSIAVDDFGTGYASLRYLQRLPLDVMKIDRTFVSDVATSESSRKLVGALVAMGTSLGLQLVAEGIETLDQLRLLQHANCELGQGYLFSAPVAITAIELLLASGHVYPVGSGDAAPVPDLAEPITDVVARGVSATAPAKTAPTPT